MTLRLAIIAVLAVLSACIQQYDTFTPPPLDFSDQPSVRLAVASMAVDSIYRPKGEPFVDHAMAPTPEAAARLLLEQRFEAIGGGDRLEAVIVDASVEEQKLDTTEGLTGLFTTEPSARLVGRIEVRIQRFDGRGSARGLVSTAATRTRDIPKRSGFAERQRIEYELVRDLAEDLGTGLINNFEGSFGDLVAPS